MPSGADIHSDEDSSEFVKARMWPDKGLFEVVIRWGLSSNDTLGTLATNGFKAMLKVHQEISTPDDARWAPVEREKPTHSAE